MDGGGRGGDEAEHRRPRTPVAEHRRPRTPVAEHRLPRTPVAEHRLPRTPVVAAAAEKSSFRDAK